MAHLSGAYVLYADVQQLHQAIVWFFGRYVPKPIMFPLAVLATTIPMMEFIKLTTLFSGYSGIL